ncbi:MAG: hypothetical protein PHV95_01440 [Eubacteriales bacterium]|nr:hypothetical protein [Eubacteriales bacterium]
MAIIIGTLLVLIGMIVIYFNIPYSPTKQSFSKKVTTTIAEQADLTVETYTKEDFVNMPLAIQKYIEHCGYIGKAVG